MSDRFRLSDFIMPTLKRKFAGSRGYNRVFDNDGFNRRARPNEGMIFDGNPVVAEALANLVNVQQLLDAQTMGYNRQPALKPNQGPSSRKTPITLRKPRVPSKLAVAFKNSRSIYRCLFCTVITKSRKGHLEHLETKKHLETVSKRKQYLTDRFHALVIKSQNEAETNERRFNRSEMKFCQTCNANYTGPHHRHKASSIHQEYMFMTELECRDCRLVFNSRFHFEKHLLSLDHIRNRNYVKMRKDDGVAPEDLLEFKEDHDPEEVTGFEFIGDVKAHYCQVCEELFLVQDIYLGKHCETEKHYEKFKEYAKKKLEELEEKKKADQEASPTKEKQVADKDASEAKDEDDPMNESEVKDDEADEESEQVEGEEAEMVEDEEAENVEDEEAENVEDEGAENVDDEEAENVGDEETENVEDEAENVEDEAEIAEDEEAQQMDEDVEGEEAQQMEEDVEGEEAEDVDPANESEDETETTPAKQAKSPSPKKAATPATRRSRRSK